MPSRSTTVSTLLARPTLTQLCSRLPTLSEAELQALAHESRVGCRRLAERERRRRQRLAAEQHRLARLLEHEQLLWQQGQLHIAGVDEAGAGPLAGPVVAAAVILAPPAQLVGVDDSKKLSARRRERLAVVIRREAVAWAIGSASVEEIEALNILVASRLAMQRAVTALSPQPERLLVDARVVPGVPQPQVALIHGDARSLSIAAASILAKVHRDALMGELDRRYPGYGFVRHLGYGTAAHLRALRRLGPCPAHRQSFAPVAALLPAQMRR